MGAVSGGYLRMRGSLCYVELASSPCADLNLSGREWKASFRHGLSLTHKWIHASLDNVPYARLSPSTKNSFYFIPILKNNYITLKSSF